GHARTGKGAVHDRPRLASFFLEGPRRDGAGARSRYELRACPRRPLQVESRIRPRQGRGRRSAWFNSHHYRTTSSSVSQPKVRLTVALGSSFTSSHVRPQSSTSPASLKVQPSVQSATSSARINELVP